MRQAMDDGVAEVLSSVVDDVGQAVERNINGAQLLYELLSAPWLRALLKIYECLLQFQRLSPSPFLPYASGLSHEIMTVIQKTHRPSHEARELYGLLSSPHIQALLSTHDSVAQSDYEPVLPPLPEDLPDDEEAMRIVCLVKNNQPLRGEDHGGSVGDGLGLVRSRWSSLRRLTLERLVPARRAWSGEELRVDESDTRLLPRGGQPHPFLPRYQSTGSCCLCPQAAEHQKKRLNQSAPSVFSPAVSIERPKPSREEGASIGGSSDDYAYPPPPVPAYSFSLPNSPVLYKKCATGGQSRNVPTPGRAPSCPGTRPPRVHTAPSSPATQRSTRHQGVSTLPNPLRHHGLHNKYQEDPLNHSGIYYSIDPHQNEPPQPPEFTKQCSVEELRSTVQTVASSMEHSSQDVHRLGKKMMAATGMITDSVEDNAQALNLLVEVVDKLQGLIVARKQHEASPPNRPKHLNKPTPPPRVSSLSPKAVRKPPTPYPHQRSPSSSSSRSSSSSSSSPSPSADSFAMSRSPKRLNGGSKRMMATFSAPQRAACSGGSNGQGATIRRNEETGEIYIARVIHGGLADRSGLLHSGDLLVEVNGNPVGGLEPEEVIQILTNSHGTILFKVIPNPGQASSNQKPVYMKAMVDYCPLQDASIPCPDAGMAFSRGDLLEVVDQSDAHWWQARKLPCAASCAGLIPSASMLKRRVTYFKTRHIPPSDTSDEDGRLCRNMSANRRNSGGVNRYRFTPVSDPYQWQIMDDAQHGDDKRSVTALEEINFDEADSDITEGIYLAGFRRSFRLWRRTSYRKRRQSCTTCSPNSNALNTPYEEVALYQRPPQENHRLIILVGAPGVGVNELRKRLIKLNPSTFQSPVPHTTRPIRPGEQSGREYHFVTKELFEYMVCNHRFVEYGESKGQLYGTSTDAIDEVLKRGRMCIIDIEPHGIQFLRTKKLKPFVIFVKAPSPERLRQTRRDARIITNFTVNRAFTEDDFVELEEASQLMEAKYRQFFDSVLVNDDLQDACIQLCSIIQQAQNEPQWIPVSWGRTE